MKNRRNLKTMLIALLLLGLSGLNLTSCVQPLPAIIPALSPTLQSPALQPQIITIPRDTKFYSWEGEPVSDGWLAFGQEYDAQSNQLARIDYYDQTGQLNWIYRRPTLSGSSNYTCAARRQDGTIFACGRLQIGSDPEVALLTALDAHGKLLWEQTLDYPDDPDLGLTLVQCLPAPSGRINAICVSTLYYKTIYEGKQPTLVVCLDDQGQLIRQKAFDFAGMTDAVTGVLSPDEDLYLALAGFELGDQRVADPYAWLLKLGPDGQERWRSSLIDSRYQYRPSDLAIDSAGCLLLSCQANYLGEIPAMPETATVFHDRFRYCSYHPAALLKFADTGKPIWTRYLNGEFGAAGQQVVCDGQTIYWKLHLTDDIVESLPYMSVDHMAVGHDVLAVFNGTGKQDLCHQFSREESGSQVIQRISAGQPVLIGYEPYKLSD